MSEKLLRYNEKLIIGYLERIGRYNYGELRDLKEAVGYARMLLETLIENKIVLELRRDNNEPEQ